LFKRPPWQSHATNKPTILSDIFVDNTQPSSLSLQARGDQSRLKEVALTDMRTELHWQRSIRCYVDRARTVDDAFRAAVAAAPDSPALSDGDARYSYKALDAIVNRMAGNLSRLGVRQGDRVAVYLGNCGEAIISVLGIARLGAVLVPVGSRLRRPELEYVLADAEPVALIYDHDLESELPPASVSPGSAMRFRVGGEADEFGALLRTGNAPPPSTVGEDDLFAILYTSGTTGRPKGAMLSHLGAVHSSLHWKYCLGFGTGEISALCIPRTHVAGLCGAVLPIVHIGGHLIVMRNFARRDFLELASRDRITHALMVPAMYSLCLLEPDLASFDLSAWRLGVYGGAPMPEPTIRRFAAAVPHLAMCNAYGATETTSPATIMPPGDGIVHTDSIGKVVPCGAIKVMNEQQRQVPPGETGELWIAGPMIVPGYWRNPEATSASFADGYWKSGDIGSIDSQGYVRIADRKKDMIIRGGFKVYPAEVENMLCDQVGVVEAAVVGQADSVLGERSVAFVRTTDALSEQAVRDFCAARMADYKVPDWVVVTDAPLPRNANGKIQKDELRRLAASHVAATPRRKTGR
jgi:acyl-CoA synthetase (AMP-forming)/AMP-acid ligase II